MIEVKNGPKKFSLAEQKRIKRNLVNVEDHNPEQVKKEYEEFEEVVKQVQAYVSSPQGDTEEERLEYNRVLNLAVLGHKKEREKMFATIKDVMTKKHWDYTKVPTNMNYSSIYDAVFANVIGLKVLEEIMGSSLWNEIEELQVVDTDIFYMQRGSRFPKRYKSTFPNLKDVKILQDNLVQYNEKVINEQIPYTEVFTPDGLRIAMTRPPLTQEYSITIRHDIESYYSFNRLMELETINQEISLLLQGFLHGRATTFITGDTGTGKTNLLQALISEMNSEERFITIEDDWELNVRKKFPGRNVVQFQNLEDLELTSKKYFKIGLRMTPMRIILPEIRDAEAAEFIKAVTRGHKGSITTGHVTDIEFIPDAIASMAKQGDPNLDEVALKKSVTQYVIDVAIQLEFIGDKRKVTRISEIHFKDGEVVAHDLIKWNRMKEEWEISNPLSKYLTEKLWVNSRISYEQLKNIGMIKDVY